MWLGLPKSTSLSHHLKGGSLPRSGVIGQRADETEISGILPCSLSEFTSYENKGVSLTEFASLTDGYSHHSYKLARSLP
ncbi:hypothetical protein GCM10023352_11250 [Rothia endophytica]|uniref:Uncharacterized protein n=1 Tax=Rothia endophytica TaxID=1324766 RepID=A0ABP9BDR1_9MICC